MRREVGPWSLCSLLNNLYENATLSQEDDPRKKQAGHPLTLSASPSKLLEWRAGTTMSALSLGSQQSNSDYRMRETSASAGSTKTSVPYSDFLMDEETSLGTHVSLVQVYAPVF